MKYSNPKLGFSFELPEGWSEHSHVIPPTFASEDGVIQVKASTILPNFATAKARRDYMAEPGFEFLEGAMLGDEAKNVVRYSDTKRNEGWLSAVREGVHYEVTWDNDARPGMRAAVDHLAKTFVFPTSKAVGAAVAQAQQLTPSQRVAQDILFGGNPPSSTDDVKHRLEEAGMVPLGRGETGTFYGLPESSGSRPDTDQPGQSRLPLSNFWYFVTFAAGLYWGVTFASGGMSRSQALLLPPVVSLFSAAVAVGRFDPVRVLIGAATLYVNFLLSFGIGYAVSASGLIRFMYNPKS